MILVDINATLVEAGKAWKIIIDPHNNQLLVGLIAQRVEHSTGIAEVKGWSSVQAWIFLPYPLLLK